MPIHCVGSRQGKSTDFRPGAGSQVPDHHLDFDLHDLRKRVGGVVSGAGSSWRGPGPGHSATDQSLSVSIGSDGYVRVFSFAGDDYERCCAHIGLQSQRGPGWARERPHDNASKRRVARQREDERDQADKLAFVHRAWSASVDLSVARPVGAYLSKRGITSETPGDVRFHRAMPIGYRSIDTYPAMICAIRDFEGRLAGIHATYLDTEKAAKRWDTNSRRMFGPRGACSTGAIRLAPVAADGLLAVAEGVETALSFTSLLGVACWAAASAGAVANFRPPAIVRALVIAADPGQAGQDAAKRLERRLRASGMRVAICTPEGADVDWNDVHRSPDGDVDLEAHMTAIEAIRHGQGWSQ